MINNSPWHIIEDSHSDPELDVSLFSLGNGILGVPGNLEETIENRRGPYINGFYESDQYVYPEPIFGHAEQQQVMVDLPDFSIIRCYINGQLFSLEEGTLISHRRLLDMQTGILHRKAHWEAPDGTEALITTQRAVLLQYHSIVMMEYRVKLLNRKAEITLETDALTQKKESLFLGKIRDPRLTTKINHPIFLPSSLRITNTNKRISGNFQTSNSRLKLFGAADHRSNIANTTWEAISPRIRVSTTLTTGESFSFEKYISYACELDHPAEKLKQVTYAQLRNCLSKPLSVILQEHSKEVHKFWSTTGLHISTNTTISRGVIFSLFSILQSSPPSGKRSIPAKGLSANSYDGHYFWDAETYVFPFLLFTNPRKARQILSYRYATLDEARKRSVELSLPGALFPWRTISGKEGSTYFLAGTAQFHLNADIAYAIMQYWQVTGDWNYMLEEGAEIIFETVRIWTHLCADIPNKGICFYAVTGPDEYTAMVNNNYFTNVMAQAHLRSAIRVGQYMQEHSPTEFIALSQKISLRKKELATWEDISRRIYLPFSLERGIHLQDEDFLEKPCWDFANTPLDKYPLLLHFHPLHIYRHQVLKQPDVLLTHMLFPDKTSHILKWRDFCYYTPLTTGDSSLSPGILSVCASALGDLTTAWDYFYQSACMDLYNIHRNSSKGLHLACMGTTWMALVMGFAGMRLRDSHIAFIPRIPQEIAELQFIVQVYGRSLMVKITEDSIEYTLQKGKTLQIQHFNNKFSLSSRKEALKCSRFPTLDAVCFDLDGVITETSELHYRAWKRLCEDRKIPFDRSLNERLRGIGRIQSLQIILETSRIIMTAEEMTFLTEKKNAYYQELLSDLSPQDIMPGIIALFRELKKKRIYITLVSASENAHFVLQRLQLYSFFDRIINPSSALFGKPDPETFLMAAEKLEVTPFNCAGIEDAASGIQAIRHAGMFSVGIGKAAKEAHWPLKGTEELTYPLLKEQFSLFAQQQTGTRLPVTHPQIYR